MNKQLVMVRLPVRFNKLGDVLRLANVSPDHIEQFALIDPDTNEYSMLADDIAVQRLRLTPGVEVSGPFSNPKIEPFWSA